MIALDTNILVYAHRQDSPFHAAALNILADLGNSTAGWESRSNGKCLFIMPDGPDLEAVGKKIQGN